MLYHLFEILESQFNLPGASLFGYLSFRAAVAVIMALLISIVFGKKIINYLKLKQVGENIRELGLEGEKKKEGTPTMGGIIIIIGTLVPVILMSNLENIYIQILIISSLILGTIGLIDDYIKVFKKDKKGLHGKFKIAGQSLLGIFIGIVLLTNNNITSITYYNGASTTILDFISNNYDELEVAIITPDKDIIPDAETLNPAYVVFNNYEIILQWNRSLRFALAVCTLKDKFKNEL